jgi:hypothetical protein
MKCNLLIISFLCLMNIMYAQDSVRITTEVDTFIPPQYLSEHDAFFMDQLTVKKAFKLGMMSNLNGGIHLQSLKQFFGYEYKFSKCLSINGGFNIEMYSVKNPSDKSLEKKVNINSNTGDISLLIEPRWYFNKNKKVNNLNGNYISLQNAYYFIEKKLESRIAFGVQRQLLNTVVSRQFYPGYFDMNIGIGLEFKNGQPPKPTYQYQVLFGGIFSQIFGSTKKNDELPSTYDFSNNDIKWLPRAIAAQNVYRDLDDKKQIFKLDFSNLFSHFNNDSYKVETSVAYERLLGKSSFSLNTEIGYQSGNLQNKFGYLKSQSWSASIEPRYYFTKPKNVSLTSSHDNLSGSFWAMQFGYQNQEWVEKPQNFVNEINYERQYISMSALWGSQSRILNNFFIELKLGLGAKTSKTKTVNFFEKIEPNIISDYKIGLAF